LALRSRPKPLQGQAAYRARYWQVGLIGVAVPPLPLAYGARDARLALRVGLGHLHFCAIKRPWRDAGHFHQQLGANSSGKLLALADGHHEGIGSTNDAILIIYVEIIDIEISRALQQDWQAVDGNAFGNCIITCRCDGSSLIVWPVSRNIDDLSQRLHATVVQQLHRFVDRAGDRGAISAVDARIVDF
jgi:hypothetical protein